MYPPGNNIPTSPIQITSTSCYCTSTCTTTGCDYYSISTCNLFNSMNMILKSFTHAQLILQWLSCGCVVREIDEFVVRLRVGDFKQAHLLCGHSRTPGRYVKLIMNVIRELTQVAPPLPHSELELGDKCTFLSLMRATILCVQCSREKKWG